MAVLTPKYGIRQHFVGQNISKSFLNIHIKLITDPFPANTTTSFGYKSGLVPTAWCFDSTYSKETEK